MLGQLESLNFVVADEDMECQPADELCYKYGDRDVYVGHLKAEPLEENHA